MNIKHYHNLAIKRQKEHQKFLAELKRKTPKNLDYICQDIHEEVFDRMNCLDCANCCKTTGPLFTEKDIERLAKVMKMKPSSFEEKFLKIDEDQDKVLQQLPCFFLNKDHSCSIYEHRPKACREYPHTDRKKIYQINHLTIKNALICPATYEFVENLMARVKK